jgi:Cd2+/Zn2+-exporting ATPase
VDGQDVFFGSRSAALSDGTSLPDDLAQKVEHLYEQGKTVSLLRRNDEILGAIAMRDEPRSDAARGIALLRAAGIHPVMLTGDNTATAAAIAGALGMDFRAELLPQDKSRIVSELQREGRVGKVGDGINDAPALATADLGIAMGGGTDVALETADAAILHGRVGDVAALVDLSRKTMRNIWQNIAIALGLKVLFFATTILGITGLWPAILADTGATVFVTLNAMRLLAWRQTA